MSDRLPPLTALRAFDAAARHMSFAKAADELNVTPAALSFQIKSLEDHLGTAVFRRLNRAVELTEAGQLLQPGTTEGFASLQQAWRTVQRRVNSTSLTVTAGPGITAKWLAPRLFSFANAHPEIELRFSASLRVMDLHRDDIDVAIRFGKGEDDGLFSKTILDDWAAPMMSPELAERIKTLDDLAMLPLLHQDDTRFLRPKLDWTTYFQAAGVSGEATSGARFSQADHAIDAALSGGGAVLGRISIADSHLRDGTLVMPFAKALDTEASYRLVCLESSAARPQIAHFFDWAQSEMRGLRAWADQIEFLQRP